MQVYTVRKQGANTDREFQAYIDLLEDIGIDITNVPRTLEPDTTNRWLYVWTNKILAERFARELGARLRDPSWFVHQFELPDDHVPEGARGPLAPLTIVSIPTSEGTEFRLEAKSLERILQHFPNARMKGHVELPQSVLIPSPVREEYERQHGPVWDQVILTLTGVPDEAIDRLGGIRIKDEEGRVVHERLPSAAR
jgi:hypothetical protein